MDHVDAGGPIHAVRLVADEVLQLLQARLYLALVEVVRRDALPLVARGPVLEVLVEPTPENVIISAGRRWERVRHLLLLHVEQTNQHLLIWCEAVHLRVDKIRRG